MTLSMGATAVLEMAAAMPPAKKSLAKESAVSFILGCDQPPVPVRGRWGFAGGVEMAASDLEVRGFKETGREKKRQARLCSRFIGQKWGQWTGRVGVVQLGSLVCRSVEAERRLYLSKTFSQSLVLSFFFLFNVQIESHQLTG